MLALRKLLVPVDEQGHGELRQLFYLTCFQFGIRADENVFDTLKAYIIKVDAGAFQSAFDFAAQFI
ncbi:uncharacterized protein J4E87_009510 [Alternaria ethzedia]|uniref:uncharacterized protein n=1 Tax=Alternaria ethzedia TaxID=181014 RepID=UPI0020C5A5B0|nr:uncharacterized protein J4E87_009510 [Alternaria ethzedia]KAI4614290.1 hypothetical protein J4E87_009510 [Alternaria ethzedia]